MHRGDILVITPQYSIVSVATGHATLTCRYDIIGAKCVVPSILVLLVIVDVVALLVTWYSYTPGYLPLTVSLFT